MDTITIHFERSHDGFIDNSTLEDIAKAALKHPNSKVYTDEDGAVYLYEGCTENQFIKYLDEDDEDDECGLRVDIGADGTKCPYCGYTNHVRQNSVSCKHFLFVDHDKKEFVFGNDP